MTNATGSKNSIKRTLIAAALVAAFLSQPHAGFMLSFVILPLLFWIPHGAHVAISKPERRRNRLARAGISCSIATNTTFPGASGHIAPTRRGGTGG